MSDDLHPLRVVLHWDPTLTRWQLRAPPVGARKERSGLSGPGIKHEVHAPDRTERQGDPPL